MGQTKSTFSALGRVITPKFGWARPSLETSRRREQDSQRAFFGLGSSSSSCSDRTDDRDPRLASSNRKGLPAL